MNKPSVSLHRLHQKTKQLGLPSSEIIDSKMYKTPISEQTYDKIRGLFSDYKQIFIAFSGGIDSKVLLHLCVNLVSSKDLNKITAIHVNHNLSPHAKKWEKECGNYCKKLGIFFLSHTLAKNIDYQNYSVEEMLRKLRYEIFAKILPKGAVLLTAHQKNDQAETLLLQLFRGAGPKGLAAMPEKVKFGSGWLIRPFLEITRADIVAYAHKNRLKWLEDESNTNQKFDRNFIRHQLLPVIAQKWPGIINTLNRVSRHMAAAIELLELSAASDLKAILSQDKTTIVIDKLKKLSTIRQKNVLRFWIKNSDFPLPSDVKLGEIIRTVINSRYDAMPVVSWLGAEMRRYRNDLYLMQPLLHHDNKITLSFVTKNLCLPSKLGVLKIDIDSSATIDYKKLKVKFRCGGEKISIQGRTGTHDLKKLMQEWGIPPWLRNRIPLVYNGKAIIAVVGYYSVRGIKFFLK